MPSQSAQHYIVLASSPGLFLRGCEIKSGQRPGDKANAHYVETLFPQQELSHVEPAMDSTLRSRVHGAAEGLDTPLLRSK